MPCTATHMALILACLLTPGLASASDDTQKQLPNLKADVQARRLAHVRSALQARNPGTRIDSVQFAPIEGLYEVVMGKNVAYMDASGRYALFGNIWDMQARRDLTADRKALLDRVDVATLEQGLALRHVKGRGRRTLYVFADPQCGYCRQLEQTLAGMDDLTVYTFVLPVLGPESRRLGHAIACAADPAASWSAWMLKGEQPSEPASTDCDLQAVEKLAKGLGITGTPTLVTADGRKKAGAMSAAELAAWLAEPSELPSGAVNTGSSGVVTPTSSPKTHPTTQTTPVATR